MSIPATALMITWPVDQNVPRTISLHQCSILAGSWPTSSSRKWSRMPSTPRPRPAEARLADARQPFVGADEHDDHGVVVARPTLTGRVSISVIFIFAASLYRT